MDDGGEKRPAGSGEESDQEEVGSLATEASRGMMWTSLSSLGARGLGFMTTIILTYWISQDQYGKANAAYEIALTLGFFCIPGLRMGMAYAEEQTMARNKAVRLPWSVNALAQAAARELYADADYVSRTRTLTAELREQMAQAARLDELIWANLEELGYGLPAE